MEELDPSAMQVEMWNGVAAMKNSVDVKKNTQLPYDPAFPLLSTQKNWK